MGIGIVFTEIESNPLATLEAWLVELERRRPAGMVIESSAGRHRRANS
jgi:hypothetical protein